MIDAKTIERIKHLRDRFEAGVGPGKFGDMQWVRDSADFAMEMLRNTPALLSAAERCAKIEVAAIYALTSLMRPDRFDPRNQAVINALESALTHKESRP